jgi:hypothetical protein
MSPWPATTWARRHETICHPAEAAAVTTEPDQTPFGWAVAGFLNLADYWTGLAGAHARTVADRLDRDAYTGDLLAADTARSVAIAAHGWALLANEMLDAAAGFAGRPEDGLVESAPFTVATPVRPCSLSLAGPLKPVFDPRHPEIPPLEAHRVRIVPATLTGQAIRFRLAVRSTGLRGTTYLGRVIVTDPVTAREAEPQIEVDIQIP